MRTKYFLRKRNNVKRSLRPNYNFVKEINMKRKTPKKKVSTCSHLFRNVVESTSSNESTKKSSGNCKVMNDLYKRLYEISPRVSVVIGSDQLTGSLLGVANNGLAYVISQDLGTTWTSILDQDYLQITTNGSFVWATFSCVVIGSDQLTGSLLGVANNGLAYVISQDLGTTWTSILDQDYLQITTNGSFVWATFSW
ncbi:hypothetical protein Btru_038636 [Bulinus truncatus]|nr:hypothetical protein Btru_038636 [Bulinus truncatus]